MGKVYKLKYTLYPTYDGDFSCDKEDYDENSGYYVHEKGTLWQVCSKEEYCKLENYDEDEAKDFMSDNCDFDYVAYMKDHHGIYMLINSLEDFELVEDDDFSEETFYTTIRTKDQFMEVVDIGESCGYYTNNVHDWMVSEVVKKAKTMEELIQDGDLIIIKDLYPDAVMVVEGKIKPFGYTEPIDLEKWLTYDHIAYEVYIRTDDYTFKKVAHKKPYGKLETAW